MPTVPTYRDFQVAPRALPSARQSSIASPGLFDASAERTVQAGAKLVKAGTVLNGVAVNMQERENADMLFRAETGIKDDYLKFEEAARNRRGQNAWGLTQDTDKWWSDAVKAHSENLTNDVQRKLFAQQTAKLRQSSLDTMSAYEAGQRRDSLVDSAQASIVSSINLAAAAASGGAVTGGATTASAPLPAGTSEPAGTKPNKEIPADQPRRQLPSLGVLPGKVHLDPALAPTVPDGAPRPLAPGEFVRNPNGSWSSEITTTLSDPHLNHGRPTTIPTLWVVDGKPTRVSEDQAVELAIRSKLPFHSYDSMQQADQASAQREAQWQKVDPQNASSVPSLWAPLPAVQDNPVRSARADIIRRVQVMGDINGWSPEMRTAKQSEYLTNLHKQVIQALVDKSPGQAQAYFKAHEQEIAGSARAGLEKMIDTGSRRAKVQSFADAVMGDSMNETDALALAHKEFSGEDEDAAVREVRGRFADADAARERGQRDAADKAWGVLAQTGKIDAVPAATLAQMDGRQVIALRKEADSIARGTPVQTDWGTYYDLRQQAVDDPEKFMQLDLRNVFSKLAPAQRHEMIELQQKLKQPDTAHDNATLTQQLDAVHNELGWKASDREIKGKFDSAAYAAIDAESQRLGRKLTYDERQNVIDRLTIQGKVDNPWWLDSKKYVFQLTPDERKRFTPEISTVGDIPVRERAEIEGALTRAKLPVTDADVIRLYKKAHGLQ